MMSSKSELSKTIENQQVHIKRVEQRLADVVTAYRNLQKEKEALESTVQVLSSATASAASSGESTVAENDGNSSAKEGNESGSEAENVQSEQQTLKEKLQTLQQNVTIITQQKSRMEQMFQSDKRNLKTENEELRNSLEEAKADNIIIKEKSDNEIKELKKQLRQSQREHERTTADHGVMVRELQTLLSTERNKSESMEHQFDECRAKVLTLENQLDTLKKQHANLSTQYQSKLNESKEKDLIDLEELKRSKEKVVELMSNIKDMETKHAEQLRIEAKRNQQLEKKLADLTSENAQRLSVTETHTAELSEQIGFIEKQRAQDQTIIQRLKDRIAQLDVENSLLTKASSTSIEHENIDSTNDDENPHDLDTLMKRIAKLKVLIRVGNDRFGKSLTIEDILNVDREVSTGNINGTSLSPENNKILHSKCQEEIDRLKSELDKYRNKTVAAFKAKAFKDTTATKEVEDLRNQIDLLREKLVSSQSLYNSENDRHTQVVQKLEACLTNIREQHRHEIDQLLTKKRVDLNELECELEKQRERTVRFLSEKDREFETMKKQFETSSTLATKISPSSHIQKSDESTIINDLIPNHLSSSIGGPIPSLNSDNNNLLYIIQEQQLRDQELHSLRKQRHELELTVRDLHKKYSYDINQLQTTIEQLTDDLEHVRLSEQRKEILTKNEHNIDYIKNVFYHYLLSNDTQVKHTMANALMTILHFSTKEKAKIESQKPNNSLTTGQMFLQLSRKYSTKYKDFHRIIYSSSTNIWFNLATEEWLSKTIKPNEHILFLWQNDKCVIIGRNQNPWKECFLERMENDGVLLARRRSGGGAVYQDLGNTCFTFLVSQAHHQLDKDRNSKILLDALRSSFNIDGYIHGRNDLVYGPDKRKFSGAAYQNTRQFALHHGTLITHVDTNAMKKYLNPNKEKLLSKGVDSVQARVINLREINPSINHKDLCLAIEQSYRQTYPTNKIPSAEILSQETLDSIPELNTAYKLYSDSQWRYGQTFSFTHEYERRFPWGTISIGIISERDGLIHTCEIYSDSLYVNMIDRLKENLLGKIYTGESIRQACQQTRKEVESEQEKTMIEDIQSWILTQI